MAKRKLTDSHPKSGKCFGGCGKKLDDEHFCFGCRTFWCDECDTQGPLGSHEPEEHQEEREW